MNKLCPLFNRAMVHGICVKEKCAWYLVHSKQCAVPLIASGMKELKEFLGAAHQLVRAKVKQSDSL